jgi:hypothetical protein
MTLLYSINDFNVLLQIARKINNVEVSWALGAALHMLDDAT